MNPPIAFEQWSGKLQECAAKCPEPRPRIVVLKEVDSTQDQARRTNASPGDVIVAWRQTNGRGRLGRTWLDTGQDGVAMTMVVPRDRPERLAIASAVGVASAITVVLKVYGDKRRPKAGIKWPNDIVISGKKIAGILIEQNDDRALIGIGVNVHQRSWPADLIGRAVSFAELGVNVDRVTVMDFLLQAWVGFGKDSDDDLIRLFKSFDVLRGASARFRNNGQEIHGKVLRIDPMRGLAVQPSEGEVWLPAATTTVVPECREVSA